MFEMFHNENMKEHKPTWAWSLQGSPRPSSWTLDARWTQVEAGPIMSDRAEQQWKLSYRPTVPPKNIVWNEHSHFQTKSLQTKEKNKYKTIQHSRSSP